MATRTGSDTLQQSPPPIRIGDPSAAPDLRDGALRGRSVAYTGKLASMSHEQFLDVLAQQGAVYNNGVKLGVGTGVLVVGQGALPIRGDGLPTHQLRQARVLQRRVGARIRVLTEEQFLSGLGLEGEREQVRPLLTTGTLCELLDISRQRLSAWVKVGLVQPVTVSHGVWHFDFQQVSAAKTLVELVRSGVRLTRVRRSLQQLSRWMPELRQPLQQLAVLQESGDLVVRLEGGELATPDGQLRFDFGNAAADEQGAGEGLSLRLHAGPQTAAQWFDQGVEQETAGYYDEAAESYRQALLVGGPDADVCFDLANALHQLGHRQQAMERYHQVIEIDPRRPDAWNNLGIVLSELDRPHEAAAAFRRALDLDPHYARAHYNLADVLDDDLQAPHEALAHWRAYVAADPLSRWGQYARSRV